jgi:hypothetical protein
MRHAAVALVLLSVLAPLACKGKTENAPSTQKPADGTSTVNEAEAEVKAVAFVKKLGGQVIRDEKKAGEPVDTVLLGGTKIDDAGLKELAALKQLQTLDLSNTKISDLGLKELAALQQLQTLYLFETKIGNPGLKELAALKQLQRLDLRDTQISDLGLKELAALKQLQVLWLDDTQVTKQGVAELQKALPECKIGHNAK